jgi:hypothetical protein
MPARPLQTWLARRIGVRQRLERVGTSDRRFVLVVTTQHALAAAARFAGRHPAQCSPMLQAHSHVAVSTLERLSQKHAQHVSPARQKWQEWPWHMALVGDSPLQQRARLPPANAQTCQQGQGLGVGPPWTHSVWLRNALLMPLRPLPFSSQRSCREPGLA